MAWGCVAAHCSEAAKAIHVFGTYRMSQADLTTDTKKKSIDPGKTRVFTLEFQNNADTNISSYSGTIPFGDLCTLSL